MPAAAKGPLLAAGAIALAFLTRLPLLLATHHRPVSNDDAIPLLMARHVLRGELSTILWNQPYNGALDAYLLAPALALASAHAAFRAYELACAALLVVVVALAARAAGGGAAGGLAGVLAAVGTPYMALMAATGPTPNFLIPLLVSVPLLAGFIALGDPGRPRTGLAALAGLVSGLAVWDSALALPSLIGLGLGFLAAGWRPGARAAAAWVAGALAGASPLLLARIVGASAASPVTDLRPRWLWTDGARDLVRAVAGLVGVEVPLVVDGPERAAVPPPLAVLLALALAAALALGARERRAWPLVGWAAGLAGAFMLSRRTGADEIRYLYGLTVPLLALAGVGLVRLAAPRRALAAAALLVILAGWGFGHGALVRAWRDPTHAARVWQVPSLEPVLDTLARARVRSAYASLQFAGRLTLESGGAVIASQAWNERVPGDPLRFRDEVDLDPRAAWVLSPGLSRGMPRAAGFRELLATLGGGWREDLPGDFVVFRRFVPPYDEGRAVPAAEMAVHGADGAALPAAVLDRDVGTAWTAPLGLAPGAGLAVRFAPARRLTALVIAFPPGRSSLAVPWVCEVDGKPVAAGPARHGLQWVNGAPRAGDQAVLAVALPADRPAAQVRILYQGDGPPLAVTEVLAYGADEPARPDAGAAAAEQAFEHARAGRWDDAVRGYEEAARAAPDRASHHVCLARARWRAGHRRRLDVESLPDGGAALVVPRPPR
jgi:hypothetical protein